MRVVLCMALAMAGLAATAVRAHGLDPHGADARVFSAWDQATLAGLLVIGALYLKGTRRLRSRGVPPRRIENLAFAGGWLAMLAAVLPWFDAAALERFSAHMAQHELMMLVAAPLLVAGRPLATCLWALPGGARHRVALPLQQGPGAGAFRVLTNPATAWALHGIVIWVWHAPALYELAVRSEAAHAIQHAMFVGTSVLFWWGLVYGRYGRAGYGAAVFYVFTTAVHTGILGALFTFAGSPFYGVYVETARVSSTSALDDQQRAGLVMWIPAGLLLTIMGLGLFAAWLGEAERRVRVTLAILACGVLGLVSACRSAESHEARLTGPYGVYVTNEVSGDLTIIDPVTHAPIASVPLGKRPRGVRASPDGRQLYVALSGSPIAPPGIDESTLPPSDRAADGIGVVDATTFALTRILKGPSDPEQTSLSRDGRHLYVANEDTGKASVLDVASGRLLAELEVGGEPEGVTTSTDGRFVYVTSEEDNRVSVIETASNRLVKHFDVGARPRDSAFSPDGSRAYVTAENGGTVSVVDTSSHRVIATIRLGDSHLRPMGVAVSPDGERIYVSTGRGGSVLAIDARSHATVATVEVGTRPWGIALSPDGTRLYTANGPSNDVSVVDTRTFAVTTRIPAGRSPWGVAVIAR